LSAPGAAFPSDADCAARVHMSTWEPRPENDVANHTMGPVTNTLGNFSQWSATWNAVDRPRIDGQFAGTTDEIIQWAACKWGLSDEALRAQAVVESSWRQSEVSDFEPRSNGHCVFDDTTDRSCPTSFSIIQVKWYYHPQYFASNSPQSSYPWIKNSTAFALDQAAAEMRGCYDGQSTYLGKTTGDIWGCIQDWYSGAWTPGGGAYANQVKAYVTSKPWLTWAG
jgi:autotransporter family porin